MHDVSNWPGGWYVYEDGRVSGPLAAEEAFKLQAEAPSGKPRMVSRKGFSQWYALKDLSEIFRLTEEMGRKAQAASVGMTLPHTAANSSTAPKAAHHVGSPIVTPKHISKPHISQPHIGKPRQEPVPVPSQPAALAVPMSASDPGLKPTKADTAFAYVPPSPQTAPSPSAGGESAATVKTRPSPTPVTTTSAPAKAASAQAALMQEYLIQRGRLRLGKLKNPWITAFVGLPLTLGVLWMLWMKDLAHEVAVHCGPGTSKPMTMPPAFLALVPGVHIYMTWRLAKLVGEMEAQNRYRMVSPAAAALFAVFPPFALAYLQDAVNKHWLLHVRHAIDSAATPASIAAI